jgi:hypothetical protein
MRQHEGNIMKSCIFAVGFVLALSSSVSVAGDFMNGEDLKKAFCGKTFTGENFEKGSTFKVYYPEKCDEVIHHYLTGSNAGQTVTWPLRISPSGDHCVTHEGKEKCAQFILNNDGVYNAMRDGKAIYSRADPANGNHLDN